MAHVGPIDMEDYYESALTMRVVGWTLLVFDALVIGLFAFAGWRDGSMLFPVWTVVQGVVGLALVGSGVMKEEKAAMIEAHATPPPRSPEPPHCDLPNAA